MGVDVGMPSMHHKEGGTPISNQTTVCYPAPPPSKRTFQPCSLLKGIPNPGTEEGRCSREVCHERCFLAGGWVFFTTFTDHVFDFWKVQKEPESERGICMFGPGRAPSFQQNTVLDGYPAVLERQCNLGTDMRKALYTRVKRTRLYL